MNIKNILILTLIVLPVGILSEKAYSAEENTTFKQEYQLLTEKNIFSRQRYVRKVVEQPRQVTRVVPKRYSSYILIGVSSLNGTWNAFFENLLTGHCQTVKVNDVFEGGIVQDINETGVIFLRGEEEISLVIGADMKGQTEVSEALIPESSGSTATGSTSTVEIPADASETLRKLATKLPY